MRIFAGFLEEGCQTKVVLPTTTFLAISMANFKNFREKASIVCSLQTKTNNKAVLWQRNRTMPFWNWIRIEVYSGIARLSLRQHGFLVIFHDGVCLRFWKSVILTKLSQKFTTFFSAHPVSITSYWNTEWLIMKLYRGGSTLKEALFHSTGVVIVSVCTMLCSFIADQRI